MKKEANIIEITHNWPYEIFIQRHVSALNRIGVFPIILARHSDKFYTQSASVSTIITSGTITPNFDHLSYIEKLYNLKYIFRNPSVAFKYHIPLRDRVLLSYFETLQPSLIHFHTASLAAIMSWVPKAIGIPYTLSIRGSDIQINPFHSPVEKEEIIQALQGAAGIHTVCDYLGFQAKKLAQEMCKPTTIYTTVPIPDVSTNQFAHKEGGIRLLSIGRLHWTKAYVNLLFAFKVFLAQGFSGTLSIIGDGPEMDSLIYWINYLGLNSHVTLFGKQSYSEIADHLKNSDAYIQSSIAEGFSNSTAEAMAFGMPVFATDIGGTSEIIKDNYNGYLLNPTQPQDWWEKLSLISNNDLMNKIRINAWHTAREHFSAKNHADNFLTFYLSILNG